jgi:hypothetical protein
MTRTSRQRTARRPIALLTIILALVFATIGVTGTAFPAAPLMGPVVGGTTLEVGAQFLHRCGLAPLAY